MTLESLFECLLAIMTPDRIQPQTQMREAAMAGIGLDGSQRELDATPPIA